MKNTHYLLIITIWLFSLFSAHSFARTELTASVDRNPVMENESFILQIVANESIDSNKLDLSSLTRSGLTVGRTSTSSQTQIINGSISKTTTWNTVLLARQAGNYRIPALEVDGAKTNAIDVKVIKSSKQNGQNTQPIFLKNSVENSELYLQQSTKLITRLYFAPNVDLQSGTLTDPALTGAIIKQQGKDKETSEIIMGVRYRVIERTYTLTPQGSGEFTIASPSFNGEISTDRRRSTFSMLGSRKPVSSIGNDLTITVFPIPTDYQGSWLPSDLVQLNDEIQPQQDSYKVGEPITRTFTLTALNVNEEQLPELKGQYPSSFNVYPDQSESYSAVRQNAIVSQRISSEAIVPTQPGTFTLPEVTINWFNTQTKQLQVARIPAKQIQVEAALNNEDNTLVTNIPMQQQPLTDNSCPEITEPTTSCEVTDLIQNNNWLITLSGWFVWLITIIGFLLFKRQPRAKSATIESAPSTFDLKSLKQACKQNDAAVVRKLLIEWAKQQINPQIRNLSELKPHVSCGFAAEIDLLNQQQYSVNKTAWSGEALLSMLKKHKSDKDKVQSSDLPPLN